ncbi:response regulator transcription factor [Litorilinea aerophila]|nr:response regulator transcription factor [Litorilinea aerophila]MCC9075246.1 response regulator transcription factor [Litorilinea aerophila]
MEQHSVISAAEDDRPTSQLRYSDRLTVPWTVQRPVEILVADSEINLNRLLSISLQRQGYHVVSTTSGQAVLELVRERQFDLVLFELLLPDVDGFELCTRLRHFSSVPIMIISALNRADDIVRALEMGADAYVTKPFHFSEIHARIEALLRRTLQGNPAHHARHLLVQGDTSLDEELSTVTVAGHTQTLTETECRLLAYLMRHAHRPVSKAELLEEVWGYAPADSRGNIVELAIRRLRCKLEEDPSQPQRLITLRNVGYQFHARQPDTQTRWHAAMAGALGRSWAGRRAI